MPRAGWCKECGEWVWVDPEGACPDGHGPECLSHQYEAQPSAPASAEAGVGVGEIPASMLRFNWGAFFVPALWGLVYGVWPIVGAWLLAILVPVGLGLVAGAGQGASGATVAPISTLVGITVIADALAAFARLWAGAGANRLYWQREAMRLEALPGVEPKVGLDRFRRRQRGWAYWGGLGLVLAVTVSVPAGYEIWKPYGLQWAALGEPAIFVIAEIGLGLWLARRMRLDNPESPAAVDPGQ